MEKLDIRYINMDNLTYVTQEKLLHYAETFKGGVHRAVTDFADGSVVIGYGRRMFTYEKSNGDR